MYYQQDMNKQTHMPRRDVLRLLSAGALICCAPRVAFAASASEWQLSKDEWKRRLTDGEFQVLREEATERPYTSKLLSEKRAGKFVCAGCALPLFDAKHKYDSGTGWPSFYQALPDALETKTDYKLVLPRTEYHCRRCGGHHGHIFKDGPQPTGLRYCNNGIALDFIPDTTRKKRKKISS
jgi:peptide-methionine (R)-S-oxide reductase